MPGPGPLRLLLAALLAVVVVVGCRDSTTEPLEPLTLEETEALYFALFEFATDTTASTSSFGDEFVHDCPLGGQVRVTGDFSDETAGDTARVTAEIVLDPEECRVEHDGYEFTLVDGNPNVRMEFTMSFVEFFEGIGFDGTMTGGVDWRLGDRSGTCMMDLVISAMMDFSGTEPIVDGGATGTMCGLEVEFDAADVEVGG